MNMQFVDYIISGDYVLLMDQNLTILENGAVVVKGNRITDVGIYSEISKKYLPSKEIKKRKNSDITWVNKYSHSCSNGLFQRAC